MVDSMGPVVDFFDVIGNILELHEFAPPYSPQWYGYLYGLQIIVMCMNEHYF